MPNSTRPKVSRNPRKPRPDFPLSVHKGSGYWCKKVRGRVHYFGKVSDDPKGAKALQQWLDEKDDLLAGREPRAKSDGLLVGDLCNEFLADKEQERDNKELSPRTFLTYYGTCSQICKAFSRGRLVSDLVPDDFRKLKAKLAKTRKAVALRNEMQRVRSIFKFAFDEGKIDRPVQFGQGFKKPKPEVVRRAREAHRAEHGDRMFEATEIRLMLDALDAKEITLNQIDEETGEPVKITLRRNPGLKAMILLAANCGFGQSDLANLPTRAVNLQTGWVDFGRGKTGVPRRIPLWVETISAIRDWLRERPKAKEQADGHLLFLTCRGARFVRLNAKGYHIDGIGQEFQKLIQRLGLKRPRIGVYSLRHGFETIAGETADQVAVDAVMGHVAHGMSAHYRERISDERLKRVVEHVRSWLFSTNGKGGSQSSDPSDPEAKTAEPQGQVKHRKRVETIGRRKPRKTTDRGDRVARVANPLPNLIDESGRPKLRVVG